MPIRESVKGIRKTLEFNRKHGNWLVVEMAMGRRGKIIASVSEPMFLDVAMHMTKHMKKGYFKIIDKRTKKGKLVSIVGSMLNYTKS